MVLHIKIPIIKLIHNNLKKCNKYVYLYDKNHIIIMSEILQKQKSWCFDDYNHDGTYVANYTKFL